MCISMESKYFVRVELVQMYVYIYCRLCCVFAHLGYLNLVTPWTFGIQTLDDDKNSGSRGRRDYKKMCVCV